MGRVQPDVTNAVLKVEFWETRGREPHCCCGVAGGAGFQAVVALGPDGCVGVCQVDTAEAWLKYFGTAAVWALYLFQG